MRLPWRAAVTLLRRVLSTEAVAVVCTSCTTATAASAAAFLAVAGSWASPCVAAHRADQPSPAALPTRPGPSAWPSRRRASGRQGRSSVRAERGGSPGRREGRLRWPPLVVAALMSPGAVVAPLAAQPAASHRPVRAATSPRSYSATPPRRHRPPVPAPAPAPAPALRAARTPTPRSAGGV